MQAGNEVDEGYRYSRFRWRVFVEGLSFQAGPLPGDPMANFQLPTTDGSEADLIPSSRPLLVILGSVTCPMTRSGLSILKELYCRFGNSVDFLSVYNREAHPGENLPQPATMEAKIERAKFFREVAEIPWVVVVDDLSGSVDRALGTVPNAVYLVGHHGDVCYRALASNEGPPLRTALEGVSLERVNQPHERQARLVPMVQALGVMKETIAPAGCQALHDLKREVLWLYLLMELAGCFKPLPPLVRGIAAVVLPLFLCVLIVYALFSVA